MLAGPRLALASLSAFLLAIPFTLGKPGLPTHLKADEPAYYLAALSLAHDGDLVLDVHDVDRGFDEFPFQPINNLVLATDDGWQTTYFGKPFLYPLAAAPFVRLAGANGMLCFNMLLTVAMLWMAVLYLERHNPPGLAALFGAGFTVLSAGFAYTFWLQPEVFNMAAVMASLLPVFCRGGEHVGRGFAERWPQLAPCLGGAALAGAVYHKPVLLAFGLPAVVGLWTGRRRIVPVAFYLLGLGGALAAVAGTSVALFGHPSAYLGLDRQGVTLCEPGKLPIEPAPQAPSVPQPAAEAGDAAQPALDAEGRPLPAGNSWAWIFNIPDIRPREIAENLTYFFVGRHTGLFLYFPFTLLALVAWAAERRRCRLRWSLALAFAAIAGFFLLFIPFNWQGGGGFLGNRYFVNAVPAFVFLVRTVRPRLLPVAGFLLGGTFLGTILLTPFGQPVPEATMQAHVRNAPFRPFPLELSLKQVPGYQVAKLPGLRLLGRRDQMLQQGTRLWIRGGDRVELYAETTEPVSAFGFLVRSEVSPNPVDLSIADAKAHLVLEGGHAQQVTLRPSRPTRRRSQDGIPVWVYRLDVTSAHSVAQDWTRESPPEKCPHFAYNPTWQESFPLGVSLVYLGDGADLSRELYEVEWARPRVPARVTAGSTFTVRTRLYNRSQEVWRSSGAAEMALSYHWLDEQGEMVEYEGIRTPLGRRVPPGALVAALQEVRAPEAPGRYVLELDMLFEHVAWFSVRNGGNTFRAPIEVVAGAVEPAAEEATEP